LKFDTRGAAVDLCNIRTKDDAEVDFCLSEGDTLTHLIECKLSDAKPHRAPANPGCGALACRVGYIRNMPLDHVEYA
jgi:hypothetical protein